MLEVALVEDEAPARARLKRLLAAHADVRVVGEAEDLVGALALLRATRPALLFLDVQLGRDDAFALLRRLPERQPLVVFATAYHEHALRAFEVAAVDYLLKPFDGERLARALARVRARLAETDALPADEDVRRLRAAWSPAAQPSRLVVQDRGRRIVVPLADLLRVSACGNYVELHTARHRYLLRTPLARLALRLDPAQFLRVHRSHLLRADQIVGISPRAHGDAELHLRDGSTLLLSRRYRDALPADLRGVIPLASAAVPPVT
ncbi:MAG: response regulator transcription factor [Xanthomonadaceae bacterium]|nr:response regulator transcription factor [Xanthomonadaceae bacterium]MDE2179025.1 response regulator transcription factor [Xanthomonadaceae bacterium]